MSLARVRDPSHRLLVGSVACAVFMLALAALHGLTRGAVALPALVPPFGASAVIVFFNPESPYGRPRNVLLGQTISAFAACLVLAVLPEAWLGIQAALAVTFAGLLMLASRSFHPPGGATALLAVVAEKKLGFAMVLCPMLAGGVVLVATRYAVDRLVVGLRAVEIRREDAKAPSREAEELPVPTVNT